MAKKRKITQRVYESGRETTVVSKAKRPKTKKAIDSIRPRTVKKTPPNPPPAPKRPPVVSKEPPLYREEIKSSQLVYKIPERKNFQENYELPAGYNTTQLTLLVKDPYWIHAYWDLTAIDLDLARQRLSWAERDRCIVVVRVYDISLKDFDGYNANHYFDLDVGFHANNWYINLWNDGASYTADLGLRASNGEFIHLCRSNVVHTPRVGYSPRSEQIWMDLPENSNGKTYIAYRQKLKNDAMSKRAAYYDQAKRKIYLSEEDIRRYYSKLSPLMRDVIAARLGKQIKRVRLTLEGESSAERQAILSNLPEGFFIKRFLKGSSDFLVVLGQRGHVHEAGSFAASEFLQQKLSNRTFFFEIWTELLVYGRTLPDANVHLGTKNIPLNPDGTFAQRFSLSDQTIHLPFTAESADKQDSRSITTDVTRRTEYPR